MAGTLEDEQPVGAFHERGRRLDTLAAQRRVLVAPDEEGGRRDRVGAGRV